MYVILVYDVGQKRVGRMLKLCRGYLNWVQNSVFEGDIGDAKLEELRLRISKLIHKETDSVLLFKSRDEKWLYKEIIGKERSPTDVFL